MSKSDKAEKRVKVIVLGEWHDHGKGQIHIDLLVSWVRQIAQEIKIKSAGNRSPADIRRIRVTTGKFIPNAILAELSSAQIIIADITSFRAGNNFNLNVAYEIGVVQMLRYVNRKKNPRVSEAKLAPFPINIAIHSKFLEAKNALSNISGYMWGSYKLDTGFSSDLRQDISTKIRTFHTILNRN